jgi:hypothetical protein
VTAYDGRLVLQIEADTKNEAADALDRIAKLASGFPWVERVTVEPVERQPAQTRPRSKSHA